MMSNEKDKPKNIVTIHGEDRLKRWTILWPKLSTVKAVNEYARRNGLTIGRAVDTLLTTRDNVNQIKKEL